MKSNQPVFPVAVGVVSGALLLNIAMFATAGDTAADDLATAMLLCGFIGGLIGSTVGGAFWVASTERRVPAILRIGACWWTGVVGGLALAVAFLCFPFMKPHLNAGRDGSGGPGVFLVMLIAALSGIVTGSVIGIWIGIRMA